MLEAGRAVAEEEFASNILQEGVLFSISLVSQVVGEVLTCETRTPDDYAADASVRLIALIGR